MENNYKIPRFILASKNIRFFNFIIDLAFLNILKLIIYLVSAFIPYNDNCLLNWFISFDKTESFLFFCVLMFLYYSLFEISTSKTLAKYITKTLVVMEDGSKPEPSTIFGRSLIRLIPIEYFTFLRGRKLGMHDDYSNTFVVLEKKLEDSKKEFNEILELENKK